MRAATATAARLVGWAAVGLALVACGGADPRYGEATLSDEAPRQALSGTTFGQAAALELAPGCPGYLDPEQPAHVLRVTTERPFVIEARSEDGPLSVAVAHGDEVRCDSDEGSGHAPSLALSGSGEYEVWVAALRSPAELAYELSVHRQGAAADPSAASGSAGAVHVTVTSEPPGAEVRDADGRLVGTTPAMFVVDATAEQMGQERSWTLSLAEHETVTVTGRLAEGALVLHGQLPVAGPTEIDVTAEQSRPIRDYESVSLGVDVAESCAITDAEVEVDIRHSYIGDLQVTLRPPWGQDVTLQRHTGGGRDGLRRTWELSDRDRTLRPLLGRDTRGRWILTVRDDATADQGSLERFGLRLSCGTEVADAAGAAAADPPARANPPRRRPRPRRPALPELPGRGEIVRVLGALRPQAERCSSGQGGNVRVMITVQGRTGRVSGVSSAGTASASERACVERVVRRARFSRFRRGSVDVDYTYDLGARSPIQPSR